MIGVLHQAYDRNTDDPDVLRVFAAALEDLRRAGAMVIDPWASTDSVRFGVRKTQGHAWVSNMTLIAGLPRGPIVCR